MSSITRDQMKQAVKKNVDGCAREADTAKRGSFAEKGAMMKWQRARRLLERILSGEKPSTSEVVGYFGKGARFTE